MAPFKGHQTRYDKSANSLDTNSHQQFINIGRSCEVYALYFSVLHLENSFFIYTMTSPLSHKYENYSEPG